MRISRKSLLSRYTQVDEEGRVDRSPLQQLAYGALLNGRVLALPGSAMQQAMAQTIAVRYLLVRRQFAAQKISTSGSSESSVVIKTMDAHGVEGESIAPAFPRALPSVPISVERPILDYPIQQRRIFPLLAGVFAVHAAGKVLQHMYECTQRTVQRSLRSGDDGGSTISYAIAQLKELHGWSAGLKAWATWHSYKAIDDCRQACGGHGYSGYSGLPSLFADHAVCVTWEGDNTLMSLQCARFLFANVNQATVMAPDNSAVEGSVFQDSHPASLATLRAASSARYY